MSNDIKSNFNSIKPENIDLNSLPWLLLSEKATLPKSPGIYFAIDSLGNVQYIGRSKNIYKRWENHHKYDKFAEIGGIRIACLFIDMPELLPRIESALIKYFDPPLNIVKPGLLTCKSTENSEKLSKAAVSRRDLYVSVSACVYFSWGKDKAKKLRQLLNGESSYQIAEMLNSAGLECSVANVKKYLSGQSQSIRTDFALKMCKILGIDAFNLFELIEVESLTDSSIDDN